MGLNDPTYSLIFPDSMAEGIVLWITQIRLYRWRRIRENLKFSPQALRHHLHLLGARAIISDHGNFNGSSPAGNYLSSSIYHFKVMWG